MLQPNIYEKINILRYCLYFLSKQKGKKKIKYFNGVTINARMNKIYLFYKNKTRGIQA